MIRACMLAVAAAALAAAQERADLSVIHAIKAESFEKSKVAVTLSTLTDLYGPRLTASPQYNAAAAWVLKQAEEWGLSNPHTESWGSFGRAWTLKRFSAHMTSPQYTPLVGFPLAWSGSTSGLVKGEAVYLPILMNDTRRFAATIDRLKKEQGGKLKGKLVFITSPRELTLQMQAAGKRYNEMDLLAEATATGPVVNTEFEYTQLAEPDDPTKRTEFLRNAPPAFRTALRERTKQLRTQLHDWLRSEGALGIVTADPRGDGGTVFGESVGFWEAKYPKALPVIALTWEHYNRIVRLLKVKQEVKLELEVASELSDKDADGRNVVAEIPGGAKADEVVIVGAHLDSWVGGTGATDNASGCSVAMEAMRILKALHPKLDRTVRMVLWSGEEQGLLGSKGYVKEHFGDAETMKVSSAQAKVSAYFNLDNGSGKIRGVYLQNNDAARPLFEAWLAPFRDLGVTTISIRNTGGTDHQSFDAVGIPGFQFIQDPLEYTTRTHHSNMDVYDHTQPADLMQASAVMAAVIYHASNSSQMMPRKPLPEPEKKWMPAPTGETTSGGVN